MESLLAWLDDPRPDTGLHIAEAGDAWSYTPYPELAAEVRRFAAVLLETGPEPGAVVSLMLTRGRCFVVAFMAALAAGLTPSPVAPLASFRRRDTYAAHLEGVLAVAEPAVVVVQEENAELARDAVRGAGGKAAFVAAPAEALAEASGTGRSALVPRLPGARDPEDMALLQFTSGSSGTPRGVRVSWGALSANVRAIRDWLEWRPDDVFASWLPLFHDMGLVGGMVFPVSTGTDLWIMTPEQFVRSPRRWLDCFGRHGATITTAPTFGYAHCARRVRPEELAGSDFSGWRVAICGAERIDPAALAAFATLVRPYGFDGTALIGAYGLAESTLAVAGSRPGSGTPVVRYSPGDLATGRRVGAERAGTLGEPVPAAGGDLIVGCGAPVGDLTVEIVDAGGAALPDGHLGEIAVRGASLADGYVLPDGTLAEFGSGTLRTGDAGFRWDGHVHVVGRIGDSLKVRGATVFAEDLEARLDAVAGLRPGRFVVLLGQTGTGGHAILLVEGSRSEPWLEEALATLRAGLAPGIGVSVVIGRRGTIQRTSSGKPRRRVLWTALTGSAAGTWTTVHGPAPTDLTSPAPRTHAQTPPPNTASLDTASLNKPPTNPTPTNPTPTNATLTGATPTNADPSEVDPSDADPPDATPTGTTPANPTPANATLTGAPLTGAGPSEMDPSDADPADTGPADMGPADMGPADTTPTNAGPNRVGGDGVAGRDRGSDGVDPDGAGSGRVDGAVR
ncbi:AMP-binding protein [Actinomadura fibrosa]|uniref:AMP-binding protein n=1 Tax=Actinomadura fibrosa TaxID=111802 RepID=A0ABW2Y0A0_9ACTN|nr:AMP-binding protein [Actinomadura fibrosa]